LSDTTYDISAIKLKNARTLKIGNTGKTFDGTANVTWNSNEVGFLDLLNRGTELADGADLNSVGYGNFYSNNSTKSATLINAPLASAGFRLISQRGYNSSATAYHWQYAITSSRKIYQRYRDGDNNWSGWGSFVLNNSNAAVGTSSLPVYVTGGGIVTACNTTLDVSITGNAATATSASKLTTDAGNTLTPVYFSGGVPKACTTIKSGAWHGGLTSVGGDGVMEVGRYIDFHVDKTGTSDYDVRITAATTGLTISGTTSGTFKGSLNGNASSATKLATARTIQTNLASTTAASFDGSANITPGVTGVLGPANGGTGKTTLQDACNALINALGTGSSTPTDADYYVSQYAGGGTTTTTYHRRPMSALYSYV
jgi:hypothetical protein